MVKRSQFHFQYCASGFWLIYWISRGGSAQQYSAQFQFVSGTRSIDHPGVYGEKGVTFSGNFPGGLYAHSMCINPINKKLLVWGGLMNQNGQSGMSFSLIEAILVLIFGI